MRYSIIGFGAVGQALARAFARKSIEVSIASRHSPDALAQQAQAIGPTVVAATLQDALTADIVFLAVPFGAHSEVAKQMTNREGKTIVDTTNAFGVPVQDLNDRPSSAMVAKAFAGAAFVKGFNHLPAATLGADPDVHGGRRVVFLASDDESAVEPVATLAEQLGFAPVFLGKLDEGGTLVQARDRAWAQLIFQDLVKFR